MTLEQLREALDRIPNAGAINKARRKRILDQILREQQRSAAAQN